MREGIYWRGNHQAQCPQENNHPDQNCVLPSGLHQAHNLNRRKAKVLIFCLLLCFVTWTLVKFQMPLWTSSKRQQHPLAPTTTRAIVFDLFRRNQHPQALNHSTHQRRRRACLWDAPKRHLLELDPPETHANEGEHDKEPLKKRMNIRAWYYGSRGGPLREPLRQWPLLGGTHEPPPNALLGQWPLLGGTRLTDMNIQPFYVKIPISNGKEVTEFFMHIDTGSGISWVHCKGRGPIDMLGPHGLFHPKANSFMNCRTQASFCNKFQEHQLPKKVPCNKRHHFRCLFDLRYGDGLLIKGSIVHARVGFDGSDGSKLQAHVYLGCADKVNDEATRVDNQNSAFTDGLIGLGNHPASWPHQMHTMGLISEYVVAICFEPDRPRDGRSHEFEGPLLPEIAGFLSFGNVYSAPQDGATVWTASLQPVDLPEWDDDEEHKYEDDDSMYTAKLMGIRIRTKLVALKGKREPGMMRTPDGMPMGFDTGSDVTYLDQKTFDAVADVLDQEAKLNGFLRTKDSAEVVKEEQRLCWTRGRARRYPAVEDFADMTLLFASLAGDNTRSELTIKPKYYITVEGSGRHQRTCFNVVRESEFPYGNLGAEALKGHLVLFHNDLNRIGWRAVRSCNNLR